MDIAHDVGSKLGSMTDRLHQRRVESRLEDMDRENIRLRTELKALRSDLERERQEREDLLVPLRDRRRSKLVVKPKRRSGLLRLAAVGAAAYVFGAKAGRERYEQIRSWALRMKDDATSLTHRGTLEPDATTSTDGPRSSTTPAPTTSPGPRTGG